MLNVNTPGVTAKSKVAVWIVVAILLVLGVIQVAQGFIDTRDYREEVTKIIQAQTGRTANIKGAVSVSLLPFPTLYIQGLELRDPESDRPAPAIAVDLIRLRVLVASIFDERPQVSGITLDNPMIEVVKAADGRIHWDWLNADLIKALASNQGRDEPLSIIVNDGSVTYHNTLNESGMTIENINIEATTGSTIDMGGAFSLYGHNLKFSLNTASAQPVAGAAPFEFKLVAADQSTLSLKGNLDLSKELPEINGALEASISDAQLWMKEHATEDDEILKQVSNFAKKRNEVSKMPVKFTSAWIQQGLSVSADNIVFEGLRSNGAGSVKLSWDGSRPFVQSSLQFKNFDFDQWKRLFKIALQDDRDSGSFYHSTSADDNPIPKDSRFALDISAEKFVFGTQAWSDAVLSADISDGAVTVNQFNIHLPGTSSITMFGVISPSPTGDLRFEGSMETEGSSLREALTVFDASAKDLPQTGFGNFKARSNMFISSEQMRLSEADVRLSDLHLNGGLVAYFDENSRLEADVRLSGINFDYFRDAWRERQKSLEQQDFFLKFDQSVNFNWLKRLQTIIDFKISVDQFTFLEKEGSNASFRLYAKEGEFGIYDINFIYPDDAIRGNIKLNVTDEQPNLQVGLSGGTLNTGYFNYAPAAGANTINRSAVSKVAAVPAKDISPTGNLIEPPKPASSVEDLRPWKAQSAIGESRWSEELIDMSWMAGFNGNFNLAVNKLIHHDVVLDNVKLDAKLENELVTFKTFTFQYWGGQCNVQGSVFGGKVPGLSVSVGLTDADLHDMLKTLTGRENITGKISLSTTVSTSGVNYLSWVSQADAKIGIAARGVTVNRFNLQGVMNAVAISRTASDVFNSVNLALPNGSTTFAMDGNLNVKNGVMKTPGIGLKADNASGNMSGEIKLVPWTIDTSTLFQFPGLTSETVPTMTVQLAGSLDAPEMRIDTSSLEAFVAKRIISK